MAARVAVIAALPRELTGLVRRLKPDPELASRGVFMYREERAVLVAAGMGASRVALAFEAALGTGEIAEVISTGLAGGCSPDVVPGSVLEAGTVVDLGTGERMRTASDDPRPVLVTADTIASVQEKARLAAAYGASIVDMEAAMVGRLAGAHGLRFRAIKGVSDGHQFELESLGRFTGKHGQFRTGAFALHTALRPATWAKAGELGGNSNRALAALAERLARLVSQR